MRYKYRGVGLRAPPFRVRDRQAREQHQSQYLRRMRVQKLAAPGARVQKGCGQRGSRLAVTEIHGDHECVPRPAVHSEPAVGHQIQQRTTVSAHEIADQAR